MRKERSVSEENPTVGNPTVGKRGEVVGGERGLQRKG
jgi:hypothetical protein